MTSAKDLVARSGFVEVARPRPGIEVVVYVAEEAQLDVEGRYAVSCETHGALVGERTKDGAARTARHPELFCEDCREPVRVEPSDSLFRDGSGLWVVLSDGQPARRYKHKGSAMRAAKREAKKAKAFCATCKVDRTFHGCRTKHCDYCGDEVKPLNGSKTPTEVQDRI